MPVTKNIGFKRRYKALTNYKRRLALVKGSYDRVAVRKSNKRIIAEVIHYEEKGDKVLVYVDSNGLRTFNWPARSNRMTAYLTGVLLARTVAKKLKGNAEYVLDIGLSSPVKNSIPFTFAKGCVDGGLKLKSGIQLDEKSYNGTNTYAAELKKEDEDAYKKQYSAYLKAGVAPDAMDKLFTETKEKIMKS